MSVSAGQYSIRNAMNPSVALAVASEVLVNGTNLVLMETPTSYSTRDKFQLSYREDGTAQLLSTRIGKSCDVAKGQIASGVNVQLYTDNDTRAQAWNIVETGNTVTIDGTAYPTYFIEIDEDSNLVMEPYAQDAAAGRNVVLATKDGGTDQEWAFVPTPLFQSGGVYELRSMLDTDMCVDVSGGSRTLGANVQLYMENGSNAQKFYVTQDGSPEHWSLRNINSGMYVDVASGGTAAGTNVQQYRDNNSRAQRWKPYSYGTTTIDGIECMTIGLGSYVTSATDMMMDVKNALTTNKNNIQIYPDNGTDAQVFALMPTTALDPNMPVPVNVTWTAWPLSREFDRDRIRADRYYPSWYCTQAWASGSSNHYEWRYRSRLMRNISSQWAAWTAWTPWETAAVTMDGQYAWVTEGIPANFDPSQYKMLQYEFQVRSVGVVDAGNLHGEAAYASVRSIFMPTVSYGTAGYSPEGIRIPFTTDYEGGTTTIHISKLTDTTTGSVLYDAARKNGYRLMYQGLDQEGSVLVPFSVLQAMPNDGDAIRIEYRVGSDMWYEHGFDLVADTTLSYNTGSEPVTPTITMGVGRTLVVDAPSYGSDAAWLVVDGKVYDTAFIGSSGKLQVPYPFDTDVDIYYTTTSDDGDEWAVAHVFLSKNAELFRQYPPAHVWNWPEGNFLLECSTEPMLTDRTLTPVYEANVLDSREYQSVTFAETVQSEYTASGLLYRGLTESNVAAIRALIRAKHVTYRAPSGEIAEVAIVGAAYQTHREYTLVEINMIEETR